jgi:ribulose-phosphate 3-epimerase
MEIIPAIIAKDLEDLKNKIYLIKNHTDWVQLDIMDGIFVENKTWDEPEKLDPLFTIHDKEQEWLTKKWPTILTGVEPTKVVLKPLNYEVHLMVEKPKADVERWLKSDVSRILVHIEAQADFKELAKMVHAGNKQFGLVLNPDTPISILENFKDVIDVVQLMSVYPGKYGASFVPSVLEKGREFKKIYPRIPLSIDGGVNEKTLPEIIKSGFDRAAVGSAIFESKDPVISLEKLKIRN